MLHHLQLQKKVEHLGRQLERQATHIDTIVDRNKCELLGKLGQEIRAIEMKNYKKPEEECRQGEETLGSSSVESGVASLSQMLGENRISQEEFDKFKGLGFRV